jgi:hypothetical protein
MRPFCLIVLAGNHSIEGNQQGPTSFYNVLLIAKDRIEHKGAFVLAPLGGSLFVFVYVNKKEHGNYSKHESIESYLSLIRIGPYSKYQAQSRTSTSANTHTHVDASHHAPLLQRGGGVLYHGHGRPPLFIIRLHQP